MEQSSAAQEGTDTPAVSPSRIPITERIIATADAIASENSKSDNEAAKMNATTPTQGTAGMISVVAASLQLYEQPTEEDL